MTLVNSDRESKLRGSFEQLSVDGVFVASGFNVRYLSGFTGSSAYVYISNKRKVLLTDFRYMEQAAEECPGYDIVDYLVKGLDPTLNRLMLEDGVKVLGIEEHHMSVREYKYYEETLKVDGFVSIEGVIEGFREIKDPSELASIRKAASIADAGFTHILKYIKAGVKEIDIALELEFFMRKNGASALSFDTIAASGLRSSLPHGRASDKIIEHGDFLTLDFGCIYEGYCSDMTRTVVIGEASEKQVHVYNTVLKAQGLALDTIRAGMTGAQVDQVAREYIYGAGYEGYFGHGLGHSLGLEVHENPRVSTRGLSELKEGMLATIEPGIYIPDFGGVRIEDLVIVREKGCENLTISDKSLIVL